MSRKIVYSLLAMLVMALVAVSPVSGQSSSSGGSRSVFGFPSNPDPLDPQASEWGLTGLWKVISAETPPARSFGASGWYDRINRNPGGLTISSAGSSGFIGLSSRVELGVQVVLQRRTLSRRMDQLGFGQATLFTLGYSGGCPSCPILQAPVFMPGTAIPQLRNTVNNVLSGRTGYYPLQPYINRRLQTGMGEVVVSGKINLYSESRGDNASVALRPWISIPTHRNTTDLFNVGSQLGQVASGIDFLVSKNVGDVADVHFNAGVAFFPEAKRSGITYVSTPNMIPLRFGFNMPRTSRLQVLGEVTAEPFVGSQTPNTSFGAADPVDLTIGLRGFLRTWLAFSAGYRGTLNQFGGDKNGFVAMLSASNIPVAPVAVPVPPTLSCSANPTRGTPGTMVRLTANASTTTGRTLNYAWTSPVNHIEGSGPEVRFDTTGLTPGNYIATVRVNDGAEGFADCTVTVTVVEPPRPNAPTASCSVDRASATQGQPVTFSVTAGNPDNRKLSYQWRVSGGGRLEGATGTRARLDTTSLAPGAYTATVRVSDDRGLTADCSSSTNVVAPPPKPVMSKLNQCSFKVRTSRVDNVCKAVLDDVALRLQSDADAASVVVGYATAKEPKAAALSAQRASNVKQYLVKDKGIAAGRVQVRSTSNGASQVEIYLVPRGAEYTGPGQVVTENATPAKPARRKAPAAKKTTSEKPAAPAAKPAAPAAKPAAKPAASAPAAKPAAAPTPAAKPATPASAPAAKPAAPAAKQPAPAAKPDKK